MFWRNTITKMLLSFLHFILLQDGVLVFVQVRPDVGLGKSLKTKNSLKECLFVQKSYLAARWDFLTLFFIHTFYHMFTFNISVYKQVNRFEYIYIDMKRNNSHNYS